MQSEPRPMYSTYALQLGAASSSISHSSSSPSKQQNNNQSHAMSAYFRFNQSSQYAPGTQQSDIARLLDPSYASSSSSGSSSGPSYSQTRVYVDQKGELHDPDYRDFPIARSMSTSRLRSIDTTRRESMASARSRSASRAPDRFSSYQMGYTRPSWEGGDDEEEEGADEYPTHSRFSSPYPPRRTTSPVGYAFSTYVPPPPHYSHYFGESMRTSSSPIELYEDASPIAESPFYEDDEKDQAKSRRSSTIFSRTKRLSWGVQKEPSEKEKTATTPITTDESVNLQRPHDHDDAKSLNVYVLSNILINDRG